MAKWIVVVAEAYATDWPEGTFGSVVRFPFVARTTDPVEARRRCIHACMARGYAVSRILEVRRVRRKRRRRR